MNNDLADLPIKLSKPALRALHGAGVVTLERISKFTEKELLALHGVGPKAITELKRALVDKGLTFRNESGN